MMFSGILNRLRFRGASDRSLEHYVTTAPSPQNAVDIFRGQWSSILPDSSGADSLGRVALFQDARISWLADAIGGVSGKKILELGPLEGGHTWMLERLGAESVLAIEANTRAFLRCLVVKELLGMRKAHFVCGDFLEYLRSTSETFQVCMASGVLYHMQNPAELIALLARHCTEHLFIWSHYYDADVLARQPALAAHFSGPTAREYDGFTQTLYRQQYKEALDWRGFCGAGTPECSWMAREDLFRCLTHFGFEVSSIGFDEPNHTNGPALAIVARRVRR